jgi:hypothetical protein
MKIRTNVYLSEYVYKMSKARHLNVSRVCEAALQRAIGDPDIEAEIDNLNMRLAELGQLARGRPSADAEFKDLIRIYKFYRYGKFDKEQNMTMITERKLEYFHLREQDTEDLYLRIERACEKEETEHDAEAREIKQGRKKKN